MKAKKIISTTKNLMFGVFVSILLVSLNSCATKVVFSDSAVTPAARGYVKVKSDKNKNYVIQVEISYLAEVERLQPAKKTYVVWLVTDQEITKNVGQMTSSSKLKATFKTVSASKPKKIFVTAENDGSIQYPGDMVVLSTQNFKE